MSDMTTVTQHGHWPVWTSAALLSVTVVVVIATSVRQRRITQQLNRMTDQLLKAATSPRLVDLADLVLADEQRER